MDIQKSSIMIVDDEPLSLKTLASALSEEFNVLPFISAIEVMKYIGSATRMPDLIILDVIMPNMDGFALCEWLKADDRLLTTLLIFISSLDDIVDIQKGLQVGAIDYMNKPIMPQVLKVKVRNYLKLHELTTSLEQRVQYEISKNSRNEQMLIQQSKMAAMGEMIGSIAHQWRQPLNALAILVQDTKEAYLAGEADEAYFDRFISKSMYSIDFMSKTIDSFRSFFKPSKEKQDFDVLGAISQVLGLYTGQFKQHNIQIDVTCLLSSGQCSLKYSGASGSCDCNSEGIISGCKAKDFILFGYENEFKQVILNIVNNSKDEFLEKNIKNGAVYITVDKDGKNIMIKICDNAGGIPNNIISKIFDPYFTTKGVQGTGIGLYMSKAIIENNMGGKLSVRNIDDGVEFMIELPQTIDSRG